MDEKSETHLSKTIDNLKFLSPRQVRMIDELLSSVGEYGRVQLTVKDGRLRFAERIESIDALKYEGED